MNEQYRIPFFEESEQQNNNTTKGGEGLQFPSLQSIGILKGLGNPGTEIPKTDIAGLLIGGLVGWWIAKKFPNMIIK